MRLRDESDKPVPERRVVRFEFSSKTFFMWRDIILRISKEILFNRISSYYIPQANLFCCLFVIRPGNRKIIHFLIS